MKRILIFAVFVWLTACQTDEIALLPPEAPLYAGEVTPVEGRVIVAYKAYRTIPMSAIHELSGRKISRRVEMKGNSAVTVLDSGFEQRVEFNKFIVDGQSSEIELIIYRGPDGVRFEGATAEQASPEDSRNLMEIVAEGGMSLPSDGFRQGMVITQNRGQGKDRIEYHLSVKGKTVYQGRQSLYLELWLQDETGRYQGAGYAILDIETGLAPMTDIVSTYTHYDRLEYVVRQQLAFDVSQLEN